jgi:hypothetical protein
MKFKFNILISLLLLIIACESPEDKPEKIISEENMVSILIDIQILEAVYNIRLIHEEDRNERMDRYYLEIFENHQTSIDLFNESYSYYQENPDLLDAIYEEVLEKLEALQTEAETKVVKAKEKKKAAKEAKKKKAEDAKKIEIENKKTP